MKINKIVTGVSTLCLLSGTILYSCQKGLEKSSNPNANGVVSASTSSDLASLQSLLAYDDVVQLSATMSEATGQSAQEAKAAGASGCSPVVTYDNPPGVYPRTVTKDYGSGCVDGNGVTRQGKVITFFSGDMDDTTNYYIESYDGYVLDGNQIEGKIKMTHIKRKKRADPQNLYSQTFIDRKVIEPSGDYTIFNGHRRIAKNSTVDGNEPLWLANGQYNVNGSVRGDVVRVSTSRTYYWVDTLDKADPMKYKFCFYPVKGHMMINFYNMSNALDSTWSVNYGDGTCDDQALRSVNGGPDEPITLKVDLKNK